MGIEEPRRLPVLTLRPPWGFAVAWARKDVENRSQQTHYRGPLAIHTGLRWDDPAEDTVAWIAEQAGMTVAEMRERDVRGMVVAVVDIVGCHRNVSPVSGCKESGMCSPWATNAPWHWELGNVRRLDEPVPHSGSQGMRRLRPEVDAMVRRQLRHQERAALPPRR